MKMLSTIRYRADLSLVVVREGDKDSLMSIYPLFSLVGVILFIWKLHPIATQLFTASDTLTQFPLHFYLIITSAGQVASIIYRSVLWGIS